MTDTFYPATTITGHHTVHATFPNVLAFTQNQRYGASLLDGAHEDDGQISCFCGYNDDDGNTVACDNCNRWNHTICYYPQYDGRELPEGLEHYCVECKPRVIDVHSANAQQRARREHQNLLANGAKRPPAKSHKKKVKEPAAPGYTNGWPLDNFRHDRNSASPRDQPPPAKRPKTSHRTSDSTTNASTKGYSRKRTATGVHLRRSLSQSPDAPIDVYSTEFVRCYQHDQWSITQANLHNDIGVTNALSEWLRAPEDTFREMHGLEKTDVLMRWDGDLDDIPGKAQVDIREAHDNGFQDAGGNSPMWKIVTVQDPIANGAYIGELKGHVGFKEEYKADAANRWPLLRHPEPFVFFHPRLPIYVDARSEGTEMRYVRRSCQPNAELRVLVTDSTDYRFCFMATEQIDPGMEVAVGWDTTESIPVKMNGQNGPPSTKDMDLLGTWVSTVLSNCGPCACGLPTSDCAMSRFDRRGQSAGYEDEAQSVKMPKARKKKAGPHISPLDTYALNSRSGSEARKVDQDDEPTDSRSASGSGGRGSGSRDITPNTRLMVNGSLSVMPELSARERKKLEREEEIFKRQEEEQSGRHSKKKRNSAGSAANTPSATSSKQLGFPGSTLRYADAGTLGQSGLPPAKPTNGKRPGASTTHGESARTTLRTTRMPKPDYADAHTQCDMDTEDAQRRVATTPPRRKYISVTQRLLERCATNNARYGRAAQMVSKPAKSPGADAPTATHNDCITNESPHPSLDQVEDDDEYEPEPASGPEPADDVSMQDAPAQEAVAQWDAGTPESHGPLMSPKTLHGHDSVLSHPPMDPPAPPWAFGASPTAPDAPDSPAQHHKPLEMHVHMPPPSLNPFAGPSMLSAGSPNNATGSFAQSPASLMVSAPMFSPSVAAAVAASPARKKLSLSDYTRRSKAIHKDEPRGDRDSSPASVASGPIVPPLQPSAAEAAKAGESSSAVEDDVKMEDVGALSGAQGA
ncbi:hypothetical protein LTR36_010239 [Oleoguttula mirabilis]|uniref:SET domain-containing protein n=1 Tax=Oleoguttula mirabilis TaxID=1507867 RepID=A0AAV9JRT8_9PEZI|nr:hypothetical protein LTR36_010239 [Oleoguttula mirabilis]